MTTDPDDPSRPDPSPDPSTDPSHEPDHHADGLDLAREQARATAGSSPAARRRQGPHQGPSKWRPAGAIGGRLSGAHPDDRDPQLLASTLGRLVEQHGWSLELRMRGVFARWPELVGDEISAHATPESFVEGRLVVRTDSTAWSTQLRLLAPTLLQRLNEELGPGTIVAIDVEGPVGPSWKKGRRSMRGGRGPRDTYG